MTLFDIADSQLPSSLSINEKLDWLRLIRTDNIGPITFYKLLETYGSAQKALDILPELSKKGGRKKPLTPPDKSKVEKEYEALKKLGGDIICASEKTFPLSLSATDDCPPLLSYIGDTTLARSSCIAIVGARNASINGRKFATNIAQDLGRAEQVVVSGLARGIDTAAHNGSLATGTIAVVAGGIDVVYPRENRDLYEQIKQRGLILAESPLGMEPIARHFPKRNRIVSGLSTGVVVIEATIKSGSLITARMAGEQGRDVYAVPGYPLDPRAAGPNKLIQEGATLITQTDDILNALNNYKGCAKSPLTSMHDYVAQSPVNLPDRPIEADEKDVDDVRTLLLENLSQMPTHVDEIARTCHVSIPALQMAVLEMELAGRLQRLPGNRIVLLDK